MAGIASMRSGTCFASALVRIRRPKIGVLAHQTQGARITERSGVTQLFREISPAPRSLGILGLFSDSEVFRNFVDAFRAFSVCRQIRTGETVEMFTNLW